MNCMLAWTFFGVSILTSITIVVALMVMNLYGKSKTSLLEIAICVIRSIHFHKPRYLVLKHIDLHQSLLILVQLGGLREMLGKLNQVKYLI